MKIVSIQVGRSRPIEARGHPWNTGIYKEPVSGPVFLHSLGLEGDEHVNKPYHGGEGRALYAFSLKAYDFWRPHIPADQLAPGLFGENVTLDSLEESEIETGDVFRLGEARIQATMPRIPCFLMESRLGLDHKGAALLHESGHPGVLFRVLQKGLIKVGDELIFEERLGTGLGMIEHMNMFRVKGFILRRDFERLSRTPFLPDSELEVIAGRVVESLEQLPERSPV